MKIFAMMIVLYFAPILSATFGVNTPSNSINTGKKHVTVHVTKSPHKRLKNTCIAKSDCVANTISECPQEGCGPRNDTCLSLKKNRDVVPAAFNVMTFDSFRSLPNESDWSREEQGVQLTAYVKCVRPQTKSDKRGEDCNCKLGDDTDVDYHIVLIGSSNDAENSSVTAEITPRVILKLHHPEWHDHVKEILKDRKVRVTGWLMFDSEHVSKPLPRINNWEIHPVT